MQNSVSIQPISLSKFAKNQPKVRITVRKKHRPSPTETLLVKYAPTSPTTGAPTPSPTQPTAFYRSGAEMLPGEHTDPTDRDEAHVAIDIG